MQFRTYGNGDHQLFVTTDAAGTRITENKFVFTGFMNEIHPYNRNRLNRIVVEVLRSAGIILNVAEVSTTAQMSTNPYAGELSFEILTLPSGTYQKSNDGNQYILFQDTEMGRGWACLIVNEEIIIQDHRDTVLDILEEGTWIRSFGIDYQLVLGKDIDEVKTQLRF
ncbi:hypothetical protein [Runella zeae]|uniref:hypothetical protein n=1 Tax=Runella zeae TaxID=94255 RepID=UPI00040DA56A|nr:hypothetical protein [Runella zeae]